MNNLTVFKAQSLLDFEPQKTFLRHFLTKEKRVFNMLFTHHCRQSYHHRKLSNANEFHKKLYLNDDNEVSWNFQPKFEKCSFHENVLPSLLSINEMQILKLISSQERKIMMIKTLYVHMNASDGSFWWSENAIAAGARDNQYSIFHHTIEHRCFYYRNEWKTRIALSLLHLCIVKNKNKNFYFSVKWFMWLCCVGRWSCTCIDFLEGSAMEIVINPLTVVFPPVLFDWNANASLHMKLTAHATHNKQFSLDLKAKANRILSPPTRFIQVFLRFKLFLFSLSHFPASSWNFRFFSGTQLNASCKF